MKDSTTNRKFAEASMRKPTEPEDGGDSSGVSRLVCWYKRHKRLLTPLAALLFWLAVWEIAGRAVAQEMLLVAPGRAGLRLLELICTIRFWQSVLATCLRVVAGFLLALMAGAVLAGLAFRLSAARALLHPLMSVVRATPVASFIILALVWIKYSYLPVFISFLMVMPTVWTNLLAGLHGLDRHLLEMARVFRFSRAKTLRYILLPGLMPYFTSACSTGLGFAWKSAVAAEVIALPALSIGRQINNARIYLETPDLFAWTIAVVILSIIIEKGTLAIIAGLERLLVTTSGRPGEG